MTKVWKERQYENSLIIREQGFFTWKYFTSAFEYNWPWIHVGSVNSL